MITLIENLPENIVGLKYEGHVTAADYESVIFPALERASGESKDLKILCQLTDKFKGFDLGALKDDFEIGIKYFRNWNKIAFVSENEWMNHTVKALGFLIPAQIRTFKKTAMDEAIKWLSDQK